jgi:anti-sigma factor RsiW
MNCPLESGENAGHLLDYAAGKLKTGARAQMERHIEACPACREFAGAQQAVWQALEDWGPAEVSLDFDRRLYARIEQDVSWWTRWWTDLLRPLNPLFRHSVPIAAAAGVVIMAGLLMNRPATVPVSPAPQSAQVEALQPEQVESALDDMEMLREFNHLVPDNAGPRM